MESTLKERFYPGAIAFAFFMSMAAQPAGAGPRIVAGPDVLASRGAGFPHTEMAIAAHPRNPDNLVGGVLTIPDGETGSRVYASFDGGLTWKSAFLPEQPPGGADPQVAFTPRGTALFAEIPEREVDGRTASLLYVWRSEDGGRTWQKPADLGHSYDHPQIAVDDTIQRFAGRIYIGVLYGRDATLGVFRSDDDGRSFVGPVEVVKKAGRGLNVTSLVVLSDGTLVMTWADRDRPTPGQPAERRLWAAVSRDGGLTFARPVPIAEAVEPADRGSFASQPTFPLAAVDRSAGPFRDRIYSVWTDFRTGRARVQLASSDGGGTWTKPREIATGAPEPAHTFQPAVAVSRDGVLGVTWFDTRSSPDATVYDVYFTVSLDGGETFLPPARLSSERSRPLGPGNVAPAPFAARDSEGVLRVFFFSAASRFPNGGDYTGLTADARGDFHAFWPDARTGTFQAWTARVRVERSPVEISGTWAEADVSQDVDLLFDPAFYDASTKELRMPVRLRNRSARPIHLPLRVRVKAFGSGRGDELRKNAPTLLGTDDGTIDFSRALGGTGVLQPGEATAPVVWRLRLVDPLETPDMHLEVLGRVAR